jgi:hypothetical protein
MMNPNAVISAQTSEMAGNSKCRDFAYRALFLGKARLTFDIIYFANLHLLKKPETLSSNEDHGCNRS